jgi:hypothetical protein
MNINIIYKSLMNNLNKMQLNLIFNNLRFLLADIKSYPVLKSDILFICHDNDRGYLFNGIAYCPLIDSLRDEFERNNINCISMASPYSTLKNCLAYGNPISINGRYARMKLKAFVISHIFGRNLRSDIETNFWVKIIENHSPRVIIGIAPFKNLCKAARIKGIEICDVQHGIIEFGFGYYKLNALNNNSYQYTPNKILCWDGVSARSIKENWPWVLPINSGNPWINKFLKIPDDPIVIKETSEINKRLCSEGIFLLRTTQWSINSLRYHEIEIPPNIISVLRELEVLGVVICIKFHPVEIRQIGQKKLHASARETFGEGMWSRIIDVSEFALPAILKRVNYHITAYSASVIDATLLGKKSGLWAFENRMEAWFRDYIDLGFVDILPTNHDEILKHISCKIFNE